MASRRVARLCGLAFVAVVAIRLAFLLSFPGDFDTESYGIVAGIMEHGGDPYALTSGYNYPPVWAFLLLGFGRLAGWTKVELKTVVGLFLLAVDAATALLV